MDWNELQSLTWPGYARKNGAKGIRNRVLVIYTVKCAEFVAQQIVAKSGSAEVELLGFGTVYNRFVTEKGVATAPEVKATHIRTIVPGFSPSYTILNGARRYSLLGEKTSLLKVTILGTPVEEGGGSDSESPDEI
jgi:hypothetical protein